MVWTGLVCVLASTGRAWGQTAEPLLTLEQATAVAIHNNRLVKIKTLDVERSEHDLAALGTTRRPHVEARVIEGTAATPTTFSFREGTFGSFPNTGPIPAKDLDITSGPRLSGVLFAQISQPLTQLRTIGFGLRALEAGRDVAREAVRAEQQTVAFNVKKLYYGIYQAEGGLAANAEALRLSHELDRVIGDYVARQVALPAESLAVKASLARYEHADLVLRDTIASLKEQLNLVLGRDPATPFTVGPPAPGPDDEDVQRAQAAALDNRPEVREARLKVQQAEYDLRRVESAARPEISLAFSYVGLYNFTILPTNSAILGVSAAWEPWDWGRRHQEALSKEQVRSQAQLAVQEAQDAVRVDVSAKLRQVREAQAYLRVVELEQQTARERLRVAIDRYQSEAALERQALEAQAASAEADQQYRQALATYWTARADFERALGEDR